jgi:hypothetical protein
VTTKTTAHVGHIERCRGRIKLEGWERGDHRSYIGHIQKCDIKGGNVTTEMGILVWGWLASHPADVSLKELGGGSRADVGRTFRMRLTTLLLNPSLGRGVEHGRFLAGEVGRPKRVSDLAFSVLDNRQGTFSH